MSIVWIDDIIFETIDGKRTMKNTYPLIYANILSILFTIIFAYFYKSHPQLQKAPSKP